MVTDCIIIFGSYLGTAVDPPQYFYLPGRSDWTLVIFDNYTIAGKKYADEMVVNRLKTTAVSRTSLQSE